MPVIRACRPAGVGVGVGTGVGARVGTGVGERRGAGDGAGARADASDDRGRWSRPTPPVRTPPVEHARRADGHGRHERDSCRGRGHERRTIERPRRTRRGWRGSRATRRPRSAASRGGRTSAGGGRRPCGGGRERAGAGAGAAATRHRSRPPVSASARRARSATYAAPSAMVCLGCASTATGRPVVSRTISATSGIRDVPPTSSTRSSAVEPEAGAPAARPSASIVSRMRGRMMSSNSARVSRISVCRPGRKIATVASVSDESASLARRHSSRRRAIAARVAGSFGSIVTPAARTWPSPASKAPRRSRCRRAAPCPRAGRAARTRPRSCAGSSRRTCRRRSRRRR